MTARVVMMSGGIGSWATAKRVADQHGTDELTLLFADVKGDSTDPHVGEDPDTYRFLDDAAGNIGVPITRVADGRTIWQVFKDRRFLGNTRQANCSTTLKQIPCRAWLESHYPDPGSAVIYIGIDWTETNRVAPIMRAYLPYAAECPMTVAPYLDKADMIAWAEREGLTPPALYARGYSHNNCGGGCVRAGQGQFTHLLSDNPERFDVWERNEAELRTYLAKDVSILRDRRGGTLKPLTLTALRTKVQTGDGQVDPFDVGGCGCFTDTET
jgi:hypothetical protein